MTDEEVRQLLTKRFAEKIEILKVKNGKVSVTFIGVGIDGCDETIWLSKQHQVKRFSERFSDWLNKIEGEKLSDLYKDLV